MKQYNKIPRYDHPVVKQSWITNDAIALEKYDGSNLRFTLYDERYANKYTNIPDNITDNDIIIGTKSNLYTKNTVQNNKGLIKLPQRLQYLQKHVPKQTIRQYHDKYKTPLLFFGENMVEHTITYEQQTPPIIFYDIYKIQQHTPEQNYRNYEQKFNNFLKWNTVTKIITNLNLKHAQTTKTNIQYKNIQPEIVQQSEFGTQAEGYVIRDDTTKRRIKVRDPTFLEDHKKIWGDFSENDPHSKKTIYKFGTNHRIKKLYKKLQHNNENKNQNQIIEQLVYKLVKDIWSEEIEYINKQKIIPYNLFKHATERVEGALQNKLVFKNISQQINIPNTQQINTIPKPIKPEQPVQYIIKQIPPQQYDKTIQHINNKHNKKGGKWMIPKVTEQLYKQTVQQQFDNIIKIQKPIKIGYIKDQLYQHVVPKIKQQYN